VRHAPWNLNGAPRRPGAMLGPTRIVVPLVLCAAIGACTSPGATAPPTATLTGHTYLSTGIEGASLVAGTEVRLRFDGGQLTASAGCNMMDGGYTIDAGRLRTTQLSMTEMGCDAPRQRQDDWLARFLTDVGLTLDGDTLTLTDGTITLTLLDKEVATPDQPLAGTQWILDGFTSGDAVSSVPADVTATILVQAGRMDVTTGCNSGGGTVTVGPDTITVGPIALTKMACGPEAMSVESAVTATLSGVLGYTIDADTLTLRIGDRGLTFRASR
jgi:heat shock protein HslJ